MSQPATARSAPTPGKTALTGQLPVVQRHAAEAPRVEHAVSGTATAVQPPPPADVTRTTLQMLFGTQPAAAPAEDPARNNQTGLPTPVLTRMERAFATSFATVRIHPDDRGAQVLGAEAYTVGDQIYFAPGRYQPDSPEGLRLIGHELAHVVQQRLGRVTGTRDVGGRAINDDAGLEAEATRHGDLAARGEIARGGSDIPDRAAGEAPAQRRVGFEFETTVPIRRNQTKLKYGEVVFQSADRSWKIVADDSNLEFVTAEIATLGDLRTIMTEVTDFAKQAKRELAAAGGKLTLAALCQKIGHGSVLDTALVVGAQGAQHDFRAKPQVTIGIELEKLCDLLDAATVFHVEQMEHQQTRPVSRFDSQGRFDESAPSSAPADHLLLHPTARAPVDPATAARAWRAQLAQSAASNQIADLGKAEGLMALVLRYLNDGHYCAFNPSDSASIPPYAKSYFPVMSRNDFHELYESLGAAKQLFTVGHVLATWQSDERWAKTNRLLKAGFSDPEDREHVLGPTVYDWVSSIIDPSFFKKQGVDKATREKIEEDDKALKKQHNLTAYNEETDPRLASLKRSHTKDLLSRGKIALNSESMGLLAMDRQDPETDGTPLALLEFRSVIAPGVTEGLDVDRWLRLAESLFAFARQHNKLKP